MIPAALGMSLRQASAALRKTDIAPRAARGAIGAYGLHATGCTQARRSYSTNDGNNSSGSGSIGHLSNSTGAPARSRWLLVGGAGLVAVLGLSQLARRPKIEAEAQRRLPPAEVSPVAAGVDGFISMDEVADHNSPEKGLWVVIKGEVYDLTDFVENHPGGMNVILKNAGKDVTDIYEPVHPPTAIEDNLEASNHIGQVDPKTVKVKQATELSEKEKRRREALENLPPVGSMLNLDDFENNARKILTDQAWAYYSSAGDDEITKQQNRSSYSRIWFKPRILVPVGQVDYSTTVMTNTKTSLPIYISPAAMAKLGHPDGELNLTRAAGQMGIVQGISANASVGLDEMLDVRKPNQPTFYQLYVNKDRSASERILKKIEERGCTAVMLTVDAPVMGKREADMRAKGEVVETGGGHGGDSTTSGGGVASAISGYIDPNLSWDDIAWYRRTCSLPLILKGIQSIADVEEAAKRGVEGVVLSNHGGRSLDFSPAPIDVLIELRQKRPDLFEKIDVYVDGGVRRGTDVLKALALGAKAVGLGRPFLYAQSGFGEAGAVRAIEIIQDEVERGMRLLGITSLDQLNPDMIDILPRFFDPNLSRSAPSPPNSFEG